MWIMARHVWFCPPKTGTLCVQHNIQCMASDVWFRPPKSRVHSVHVLYKSCCNFELLFACSEDVHIYIICS